MESFLSQLGDHYEAEIAKWRDSGQSLSEAAQTVAAEWDHSVTANVRRIIAGKGLTDRSFLSIRGKLRKRPEYFQGILAALQGDEDTLRLIQEGEVAPEPAVEPTPEDVDVEGLRTQFLRG